MKTKNYHWVLLIVTFVLGGCAYAPGLYTGNVSARTTWLNPGGLTGVAPGDAASDAPPAGALRSITPELIRQQRASQVDDIPDAVKQLFATPATYVMGSGDLISIVVWEHPQFTLPSAPQAGSEALGAATPAANGYNVNPDGMIQFPYVGAIKLAGLTEYQARDLLASRLRKFIKDPQITVRVLAYRSGRVYIDGEIRSPGLQALTDIPMTLPEAIARAGGFTPNADRAAIAITRNAQTAVVNLPQLIAKGINPSGILLRHGDLLRVLGREDAKVFVLGEVLRPSTQSLRNGRLTLNEALSEAGGINPNSADPRQIFVVRTVTPDQPEIFHLDAKSPFAYAVAEGFELKTRDVIYVDPVPLVRWNRVISLILPSAQAVTTTRTVTGN